MAKVVNIPNKNFAEEREIELGELGIYVVTPTTKDIMNKATIAYNNSWWEALDAGLFTDEQITKKIRDRGLLDESKFGGFPFDLIVDKEKEIETLSQKEEDNEEVDNTIEIEKLRAEISDIRSYISESNIPQSAEDYANTYSEAVVLSNTVFLKTEDNKKIKLWKTPEDYLNFQDNKGLTVILSIEQRLLDSGISNDEETIKQIFPSLAKAIISMKEDQDKEEKEVEDLKKESDSGE